MRRRRAACSLVALSGLLLHPWRVEAQDTSPALASATAMVRAGQYDAAIAATSRAIREHPADPRLRTVQGIAYTMKGDNTEALRSLRGALRVAPGFPAALRAEAQILTGQHSPEAIPVLQQILKANPEDTTAREMLALEQAGQSDCSEAIPSFTAVGPALEQHAVPMLRYGGCLYTAGRFGEAAGVFLKLEQLEPGKPEVLYDLALSQVGAGDNKAALDTLAPILGSNADLDTLTLASDAAEATGDTPRSVALLRRAIVLDPTLADSYVRFAELCMLHESYDAGIDMVTAGLSRLPKSPSLFLARGMLYGGKSEYAKAEADFHSAEEFDPAHGTGSYGVGLIQAQADRPGESLQTTQAALRKYPDDPQLNLLMGRLLIEEGAKAGTPAFAEATADAQKAVSKSPDFLAARNLLAKIYMLAGDPTHAIEQCRAALKIDPTDETATYRLLSASRQVGDTATVRELAQRVAEQHQHARDDEEKRLRFRIEDAKTGPAAPPPTTDAAGTTH